MAYTVSFVTNYIRSLLESDIHLKRIQVEGEISNITYHKSGVIYFTLKDTDAVLSAVMYRSDAARLSFRPSTGDKIIAEGRIGVYVPRGNYQMIVSSMKPAGEGELFALFNKLKEELGEKGMFDESYKRPIPPYIKKLGVVTSPTGAAIRDIINITKSRNPYVDVILYPALVQGAGAAQSVAEGIMTLDRMGVDVIIAGRGGGSIEDLWAFNEEVLADAIFACDTPVISAVGHETDFTISDFVADYRAPTPTAAAVKAVFNLRELMDSLEYAENRLSGNMFRQIDSARQMALTMEKHLKSLSPERIIEERRNRIIQISKLMEIAMDGAIAMRREQLVRAADRLNALSPLNRLTQGYSYVTDMEGKKVYRKSDVNPGDELNIRVTDGDIKTKVMEII